MEFLWGRGFYVLLMEMRDNVDSRLSCVFFFKKKLHE